TTKSFIAGAALRLANWAGVKGTINPALEVAPAIVPVVVVDDLRQGYTGPTGQGRLFSVHDQRVANSNTFTPAPGSPGVIIDRIYVNAPAAGSVLTIAIKGPNVAATPVSSTGFFQDDLRSIADQPGPLWQNGTVIAGQIWFAAEVAPQDTQEVICGFFLAPGSFLTVTSSVAAQIGRFSIHGREVGRR
ncbi:MAG: hypothetical protein ACREJC_22390, partial [Tepidisphaeraceae bacterium]